MNLSTARDVIAMHTAMRGFLAVGSALRDAITDAHTPELRAAAALCYARAVAHEDEIVATLVGLLLDGTDA